MLLGCDYRGGWGGWRMTIDDASAPSRRMLFSQFNGDWSYLEYDFRAFLFFVYCFCYLGPWWSPVLWERFLLLFSWSLCWGCSDRLLCLRHGVYLNRTSGPLLILFGLVKRRTPEVLLPPSWCVRNALISKSSVSWLGEEAPAYKLWFVQVKMKCSRLLFCLLPDTFL